MKRFSRRDFLRTSAALAGLSALNVSVPSICTAAGSPNEKLNLAFVGVWGQVRTTMEMMKDENFYAFCDVDEKRLGMANEVYPGAKQFRDYRKMLEDLEPQIDAVIVSTPDHMHAAPSVQAMRMKKHCYTEKPLAHDVHEARVMQEVAKEMGVVTQLGTQPNAGNNYYETEEIIKSGAIGKVSEVHVWNHTGDTSGYAVEVGGVKDVGIPLGIGWGQPSDQKQPVAQPVPAELDWDLWLGAAEDTPYNLAYVPANWRRWWRFGSGQLGDFGCHFMNLPIRTLGLLNCDTVQAWGPKVNPYACPEWLRVRYTFPATKERGPVTMTWYDGKDLPEMDAVLAKYKLPSLGRGILFVGTEGFLIADYGTHKMFPEAKFADYKAPDPFIPRSCDGEFPDSGWVGHYHEFLRGCKANDPKLARCPFAYAGRMTETVLLGTVAYKVGKKLKWDAEKCKTNDAQANKLLALPRRKGFEL